MLTNLLLQLGQRVQSMLFIAPVILLAIVSHEYAHGWVSDRLGDPTPRHSGRLSLNPFRHLDIMGALCLLIFCVGWAKPVPIDPRYYKDRKKGILYVSLAGPGINFILAFLSLFLEGILMKFGSRTSTLIWILCQFCYYSAVINIGLGLFNLVPIPPLDGSQIAASLSEQASRFYWKYQRYWRLILIILIVSGILSKPLNWLNELLLNAMWRIIRLIINL